MSGSLDTITADASQLPADQRLTLVARILSSMEPERSSAIDRAWDLEIRDRIARYDSGEQESIPVSEVFSDIDRDLTE